MAGTGTSTVTRRGQEPGGARGREAGPERPDPGGRVVIEPAAVEKAAAWAVREVPGAHPARSRAARVRLSGDIALIRLRIGVRYPDSVRETAARVRGHVGGSVERLTGKRVHHVDIEIVELVR